MARVVLRQPGEDVFVGGAFNGFGDPTDIDVIGTASGGEVIDVEQGDIILDSSFNRGGDTIRLEGEANQYTARREGSRVILESIINSTRINIPVGEPITIIFGGDDTRVLRIVNGEVVIGDEVIDGTPTFLDSLDQAALTQALFNLQQAEADLQDFLDANGVDSAADAERQARECEARLRAARQEDTDSQLVAEVNQEQADVEAARRDVDAAERGIDAVPGLREAIAAEEAAEARVAREEADVVAARQRVADEQADVDAAQDREAREERQVAAARTVAERERTEFAEAQRQFDAAQAEFIAARDALAAENADVTRAEQRVIDANAAVQAEGEDVSIAFEAFEDANPPADLILLDDNLGTVPNENNEVVIDRDGDPATPNEPFIIRDPTTGELVLVSPFDTDPLAQEVLQQVRELDAAEEERADAETDLINQQTEQEAAQARFDTARDNLARETTELAEAQRQLDAAEANLDQQEAELADARADLAREERELEVAQANLVIQENERDQAIEDRDAARARTDALDPGGTRRDAVTQAEADLAREEAELRAAIEALEERRALIEECREERAIANEAARLEAERDAREDDVTELGFSNVEIVDGDNGVAPAPPEGTQEDEEATAGNDAFIFVNDEDVNEFFVINNFGDQGDDVLFIGDGFTLVRLSESTEVGDDDVGDDNVLEIFVQQQDGDTVLFIEDDPFDGNANSGGFTGDIIVLTDNLAGDVNLSDGGFITVDDGIFGAQAQNANFA